MSAYDNLCPCCGDIECNKPTKDPTPAASGLDDQGSWMGQALHDFTEYFVKNYPGPDTIICDPKWHAPKLFRNALWHIEQAQKRHALAAQPAPGVGGLKALASYPLEQFSQQNKRRDFRLFGANDWVLTVGDVLDARAALSTRPAESVAPVVRSGLIDRARAEYRDSDAAGDVLDWMEEQLDAELVAQGGEAVLGLPEDGAYLIRYDDHDEADELFAYSGARENAFRRYRDRSSSWNAHLYVKIDSNSRDCEVPSAKAHPAPAGGDAGESR